MDEVQGVFTPGGTYTLTVTAVGDVYSVYVNGSSTPITTLTNSDFTYGQIGLYDDQPNTITGSGFGPPSTFSDFNLTGTLYGTSSAAPEPASMVLFACGLAGLAVARYRRKRA